VYGVCHLRSRHLPIDGLYYDGKSSVYLVRGRVDLQYDYERGFLYSLCDGLRSWNHLSVHCVYCHDESRMYGMYGVCCWNLPKYGMYGLGQHGMYFLRSRHIVQHRN